MSGTSGDGWVVALDHGDGVIDVCCHFDTREAAERHCEEVGPADLKPHSIVCTLAEARRRKFRYTEPYVPSA